MPKILDGAAIAAAIKQEVAEEVKLLAAKGIRPGLAAVLVGHVPASEIYVRNKVQTCAELGLYSELITPPDTVTTEEMMALVETLNNRDDIDGVLIQLPLPKQVDAKAAEHGISNEEAKKLLLGEKEPSMQFTTPEELGELAVFFCSPAANNVRGVAWNMDGGWAAQ